MVTTDNLHLKTNSISAINFSVCVLFSSNKEKVKLFFKNVEGSLLWFWQEQTLKWTNSKYHGFHIISCFDKYHVRVSYFINYKN